MNKPIIKLNDVWKTYHMGKIKLNALQGISLEVKKGEILAITGKSGSGKSTIMNLVGCLDVPSKGQVFLESKDVKKLSESKLAQIRGRKIGFIFQQFNLIPTLTALENVAIPGEFQNGNTIKLHKRAKQLLDFVDMGDRINHKPTQLSGGQMQRVAIARSLINDPDVILADEPTGALDSKTGENVMKLLINLNKEKNKSIVIVTHDPSLVRYAQRVIELKDGKVLREYSNRRKAK